MILTNSGTVLTVFFILTFVDVLTAFGLGKTCLSLIGRNLCSDALTKYLLSPFPKESSTESPNKGPLVKTSRSDAASIEKEPGRKNLAKLLELQQALRKIQTIQAEIDDARVREQGIAPNSQKNSTQGSLESGQNKDPVVKKSRSDDAAEKLRDMQLALRKIKSIQAQMNEREEAVQPTINDNSK